MRHRPDHIAEWSGLTAEEIDQVDQVSGYVVSFGCAGNLPPFTLPSVGRKKLIAAFDGDRLTSDGGVTLLSLAERRLGLTQKLAAGIADSHRGLLVAARAARGEDK